MSANYELKSRTLITENKKQPNAAFVEFHTMVSTKQAINKLKQFKKYLHDDNAPFKAMLINDICFIVLRSKCPSTLEPYFIDLEDTSYPTPSNVTIYITRDCESSIELGRDYPDFKTYSSFIEKLMSTFDSAPYFNFYEAFIDVKAEMGYTPIDWLQFTYESNESMVYWEERHVDLFRYEESPYRLMLLGGTAFIFKKEDCPKHWKALYSTPAGRYTAFLDHKVLDGCEDYRYINKKNFVLSWADDPILKPALSETDLMETQPVQMTGSIKHNGCSIVYPDVMNNW
jgi:hypothetical protein